MRMLRSTPCRPGVQDHHGLPVRPFCTPGHGDDRDSAAQGENPNPDRGRKYVDYLEQYLPLHGLSYIVSRPIMAALPDSDVDASADRIRFEGCASDGAVFA